MGDRAGGTSERSSVRARQDYSGHNLDRVRDLLFGSRARELEAHIEQLHKQVDEMSQALVDLRKNSLDRAAIAGLFAGIAEHLGRPLPSIDTDAEGSRS